MGETPKSGAPSHPRGAEAQNAGMLIGRKGEMLKCSIPPHSQRAEVQKVDMLWKPPEPADA